MVMDVYASGSQSIDRIAGRATLLRGMFLDMKCLRIDVRQVSEWDAALWVRSKVNGGTKTAGSQARTALVLAERFSDEQFYAKSALATAQAFPLLGDNAAAEPAKPAVPLLWHHIEKLEETVRYGATAQQRIMAGFFVFLVHASHRSMNGQRSRKIRLLEDALVGESRMKGKRTWTK